MGRIKSESGQGEFSLAALITLMDYAIILSALEEVSDTNGELASLTSVIGIAGVTVDKTVVVADVEADDVEEINGGNGRTCTAQYSPSPYLRSDRHSQP